MNLLRSYNNWRRYRDTVNELNQLSTRELNDLGISAQTFRLSHVSPRDANQI